MASLSQHGPNCATSTTRLSSREYILHLKGPKAFQKYSVFDRIPANDKSFGRLRSKRIKFVAIASEQLNQLTTRCKCIHSKLVTLSLTALAAKLGLFKYVLKAKCLTEASIVVLILAINKALV